MATTATPHTHPHQTAAGNHLAVAVVVAAWVFVLLSGYLVSILV